MKKILILFLFSYSFSLFAQWTVERVIFIPPEYYVGDTVEMEILLKLDKSIILALPDKKPEPDWLVIDSLSLEQEEQNALIRLQFRSYYPGIRAFPNLDMGAGILKDITLSTSSVSQQQGISDLQGLREQAQLPGSSLLLSSILLLVLIIPPLLFFIIRFVVRRIKILVIRWKKKAPFKRLKRLLENLQEEQIQKPKGFYTHLSAGLRRYMSDKTQIDYSSYTTREMTRRPLPGADPASWSRILSIFRKADLVTYAGDSSSTKEMKDTLQFVEEFTASWEEEDKHDHL